MLENYSLNHTCNVKKTATRMVQLPATAAIQYVAACCACPWPGGFLSGGAFVRGSFARGHLWPGDFWPGGILSGGTFVRGVFCPV